MKIWLQTAIAIGKDPKWRHYEKALETHAKRIVRPGNTVDLHGVDVLAPGLDRSAYVEFANSPQIISNAIRAEKEGYDVFAFTCMLDPMYFELREVVSLPIAFSFESCCHVACLLGRKFAVVGNNDIITQRLTGYAKYHQGLGDRVVPGGSHTASMEIIANSFDNPEPLLEKMRPVARKLGEQGADMLIFACGICNMVMVTNGIREIEGVPLIDSMGTSLKMAEFLGDLKNIGMERVNRGLYTRLSKEEVAAIRQLYKLDEVSPKTAPKRSAGGCGA